jgi:ribosome biogenesis GTPase
MELIHLGWGAEFEAAFLKFGQAGLEPARVAVQHRQAYGVYSQRGEVSAEISGRFRHETAVVSDFPAVGDWVVIERLPREAKCVIHAVLPRRTKFSRTAPGGVEEQVVAANVDDVALVASLTALNLRRLERYLTLIWESGASPLVVLTKADLCADSEAAAATQQVCAVAGSVPVYAVSNETGVGLDELRICLRPGRTLALLGPSGVGKSSLINRWWGEARLEVQPVRERDQKGRHTTTRRQLFCLPNGALVIDTPGMRELQLWEGVVGVEDAFADVAELARGCRFQDCRHETEPGCAVLQAVQDGALEQARLLSHRKLQREAAYQEQRHDKQAQAETKKRHRVIHKMARVIKRERDQE